MESRSMPKHVIEVYDEADRTFLGYFGGRVPKSVDGPLVSYELKIVETIDEAESFVVENGATINAVSLEGEFSDKVFKVCPTPPPPPEESSGSPNV